MRKKNHHGPLFLLPLLFVPFFLISCAELPQRKEGEQVNLCALGRCEPAPERYSVGELVHGIYNLFKNNENSTIKICEADEETKKCNQSNISFFFQGGPIPGFASLERIELKTVFVDYENREVQTIMNHIGRFTGVSATCEDSSTTLTVKSINEINMTAEGFYCNWLAIGNSVTTIDYAVNFVDLDQGVLGPITRSTLLAWGGWEENRAMPC